MRNQRYQEECIDFTALIAGWIGYVLVYYHSWEKIYHTDLLHNNITTLSNVSWGSDVVEERLEQNNTTLFYAIPSLISLLWLWCFVNRLCTRYYGLVFSYTWYVLAFCQAMLSTYWQHNQFENVENPDDSYIFFVSELCMTGVVGIPTFLCFGFFMRHSVNYCYAYNIHLDITHRYPRKCGHIAQSTLHDIFEFFMIPFVHIFSFACLCIVLACAVMDENGNMGHLGIETNLLQNNTLMEKDIGIIHLEKTGQKQSPFDRMV